MKKHRLGYLDSARGLAAILVLIFHAILTFSKKDITLQTAADFFEIYFDLGKIAVIVFFIISGFVIPYSIRGEGMDAVKNFGISRFFRLYPVYWVSAILGFILFPGFSILELVLNFTMLQQFIGVKNIIGLYWTLQIELVFYFLIVFVFLMKKLSDKKFLFLISLAFLIIALCMAFVRYQMDIKLPLALPLALSIMFFGSYYRYVLLDEDPKAKTYSKIYLYCFFVLMPIINILGYNKDMGFNESWYKYTITYYTGMILFLAIGKFKITSGLLEYFGKISYSVYLFHPIAIFIIQHAFPQLNGFLLVLLVLLFTIGFSHLTYVLVEKPSIALGRKVKSYNEAKA
ncbi:acyltransferase family protein [Flavobacterium psychrotrophum]|uniref:acyltransferase family protein n=1 Tax=Flavobacterium psychrotrophum TaxID=2294119 RepID=UPI000E3249AB|nr:acyltransferase [Flavobacterium psychrotrophum]